MSQDSLIVRILLLGDDSVGKTSIIMGLATEEPPILVPNKAHDLYITGELTNQSVPALIVDSCSTEQSDEQLESEIKRADVICLTYSLTDPKTCRSVVEHWLPMLETVGGANKPVVILANKCDAIEGICDEIDMFDIRDKFPQVEASFRVSALELINLIEAFQFAQKTIIQPIRHLMDFNSKEPSFEFNRAMNRIFRIFDSDGDGVVTWHEMLEYQITVFKNLLYRQTLQELRENIQRSVPGGLTSDGFTFPGFMFIHKLFILRGMRDSIWKVLSTFGYNTNLEFDENYLVPCFNINPGEYVELNNSGIEFLTKIHSLADKDHDGALNAQEFKDLFTDFKELPFCPPDTEYIEKTLNDCITLNGFLSLFIRATHISPNTTLTALSIFGFGKGEWDSSLNALQTTSTLYYNKHDNDMRTTYVCYVFGNFDSGKSSFLNALLRRDFSKPPNSGPIICAAGINDVKKNSFIIFEEVPWYKTEEYISTRPFDMAIFVFDCSEPCSFQFCWEIHSMFAKKVPCLFVGSKMDQGITDQICCNIDIKSYCAQNSPFPLMYFSVKDYHPRDLENMFRNIANYISAGSLLKRPNAILVTAVGLLLSFLGIVSLSTIVYKKSIFFSRN